MSWIRLQLKHWAGGKGERAATPKFLLTEKIISKDAVTALTD